MSTQTDLEAKAREWLISRGMWPEQLTSRINVGDTAQAPMLLDLFTDFARSLTQPKDGLSEAKQVNGLTPEEAYKCWRDAEYNWPRLPTPRPPWIEYFPQVLRERAHPLAAHSEVGEPVAWMHKDCENTVSAGTIARYPAMAPHYTIPLYTTPRPTEQP